jgi:putative secretion ATPase (PEP-CTERM system associated)
MYERFYQLRNRPFALSPDPDFLYPSRVHREALDYLRFGIEGHAGFVVITGEIGSGKTTLLQVLLRALDGQTTVIRLVNTLLTGPELLESMLLDLGVVDPPPSKPAMLRELARILVEQRSQGRRVIAVIDEAQNLSAGALEELRMLSNLETEKSKLIQIVLVGQPGLRDALEEPSLEQLRQRVTVRYHLGPLDADETEHYINHRLKRAAIAAPLELPRDVTDLVYARSSGLPRMVNVICDAVLLVGYAENSRIIDVPLARLAISELEASTVLRPVAGSAASALPAAPAAEPRAPERAQASPTASPVLVASRAAVAPAPSRQPAPAAAAGLSDFPLRKAASATERPLRNPVTTRQEPWVLDRAQALRAAAPSRQVAHTRSSVAPQPSPLASAPERSSGWAWVKAVLFGLGPEVERR